LTAIEEAPESLVVEVASEMAAKKPPSTKPPTTIFDAPAPPPDTNHPGIVVNVNLAPPPAPEVPPAPPSIDPTAVPLPPSVDPSPVVSTMQLPKFLKPPSARTVIEPVEEEEEVDEEPDKGGEVVTQIVTTTTTRGVPAIPPETGLGFVENDPDWKPPTKPLPLPTPRALDPQPVLDGTPGRVVETTTTETVTYPGAGIPLKGNKASLKPIPMGTSVHPISKFD